MTPIHKVLFWVLGCLLGLAPATVLADRMQDNYQFALAYAETPRLLVSPEEPLTFSTELDSLSPTTAQEPDAISTVDLTRNGDDLWVRIRKGFGMPDLVNPLVDERINYYASRPQALRTMLERGRKYLYHIVGELEKRGMPTELALLPLVESAFNPQAMSSAKAAGLWQFIPSTGKDFQLTQNWWVDQRRDVIASTNAALQYLQALYELHGDWHLALASYNWGENAVSRAINNNKAAGKSTDFNSLNMPAETRQYVPKLQALKQLVAPPENYGIMLPSIPNQAYFKPVERKGGMDVAVAARLAEMPQSEFLALNPAFNRPVIPGHHENNLVLPVENAHKFEYNLAHYSQPLLSWKTYELHRTERIDQLAKRLGVDPETLRSVNSLPMRARLATGYTLLIPQSCDTSLKDDEPSAEPRKHTESNSSSGQTTNFRSRDHRNAKEERGRKTAKASDDRRGNIHASKAGKVEKQAQKRPRSSKLAQNSRNGRG